MLGSGQTQIGVARTIAHDSTFAADTQTFHMPLPAAITQVEVVPKGGLPTANCPGTVADPQAVAGVFCFYTEMANQVAEVIFVDPTNLVAGTVGKLGFSMQIQNEDIDQGSASLSGAWAVTAP